MNIYLGPTQILSKVRGTVNGGATLRAVLSQAIRSSETPRLVGHHRRGFNSHATLSMTFPKAHWSESDHIEARIKDGQYQTWGFPIYRCSSYSEGELDDVRWKQFMTKIDLWAKEGLSDFVIDRFKCTVHEDPSFDGASKEFVRSHLRKLSKPGDQHLQIPHHEFCLYVDDTVVADVLKTGDLRLYDEQSNPSTLALIDVTFEMPDPENYDYLDAGFDLEVDDLPDPRDEGEVEVEGCKMYDVGWMRVPTGEAVGARMWNVLHDGGWIHAYCRPPEICHP